MSIENDLIFPVEDFVVHIVQLDDPDSDNQLFVTYVMRGRWIPIGHTPDLPKGKEEWLMQEARKIMQSTFGRDSIL